VIQQNTDCHNVDMTKCRIIDLPITYQHKQGWLPTACQAWPTLLGPFLGLKVDILLNVRHFDGRHYDVSTFWPSTYGCFDILTVDRTTFRRFDSRHYFSAQESELAWSSPSVFAARAPIARFSVAQKSFLISANLWLFRHAHRVPGKGKDGQVNFFGSCNLLQGYTFVR
jgi:hypothetical protein